MSKKNTSMPNSEDRTQKKDWVRILSFGIIAVCIGLLLTLLGIMVWRATCNEPKVHRVIVTSNAELDSLQAFNYINKEQVDSMLNAVRAYDDQLAQKYQYLIDQREQDSRVFSWGSLIVGIVIAVFGWFGFQSFTTIEDKAKRKAESVAKRIAWTATQKFIKEEGKNEISEAAKENLQSDAINKVKDRVVNELNTIIENRIGQYLPSTRLDDLDKRVESLENTFTPEIDRAVKDAVKAVMDKYRKQGSGSNNKEEKK